MSGQVNIPAGWDVEFIEQRLPQAMARALLPQADGSTTIRFMGDFLEEVQEVLDSYPTQYLAEALVQKLRAISDERDRRIQSFTVSGFTIPLDLETRVNLGLAAYGLERNPQVPGIKWSLGGGEFIDLPRELVLQFADGGFLYVQNLFSKHCALAEVAKTATNISGLAAIDETDDAAWAA